MNCLIHSHRNVQNQKKGGRPKLYNPPEKSLIADGYEEWPKPHAEAKAKSRYAHVQDQKIRLLPKLKKKQRKKNLKRQLKLNTYLKRIPHQKQQRNEKKQTVHVQYLKIGAPKNLKKKSEWPKNKQLYY